MKKVIIIIAIVSICTLLFADSIRKNKKYGVTGLVEYKAKTPRELIDSLEAELANAQEDTNKVKLLFDISYKKSKVTGDNPIPYAEKALELSQNINWRKGEGYANRLLGIIYYQQNNQFEKSLEYYEKAISIGKEIDNKQLLAMIYGNISNLYNKTNNLQKSKEYAELSLQIATEINDEEIKIVSTNSLGSFYKNQSNYKKAIEYFEMSLESATKLKNLNNQGVIERNICNLYKIMGENDKAIEYANMSLKHSEEALDSTNMSAVLQNIGSLYRIKGDYNKSLAMFQRAIEIQEKLFDYVSLAFSYQNLANLYMVIPDLVKSYECLAKALKYSKENKDINLSFIYYSYSRLEKNLGNKEKTLDYLIKAYEIGKTSHLTQENQFGILTEIAAYFNNQMQYDKAIEYGEKALAIATEINNIVAICDAKLVLGYSYYKRSEHSKALKIFEEVLQMSKDKKNYSYATANKYLSNYYLRIAKDLNYTSSNLMKIDYLNKAIEFADTSLLYTSEKSIKIELLFGKSEMLKELGNHKEALEHFKKAQELKDSIFSSDTKVKIANLEAQRELEVKNKELVLKAKENELLQANNTNQTLALEKQKQQVALLNSQQSLQRLELEKRQNQLSLLQKDKTLAELNIRNKEAEAKSNAQEIKLLQINQKQQESEIKTKNYQLYLSIFGIMSVLFVAFIVYRERKKSEELLLNILPATIAKRLKAKEQPIADHFDSASVMFVDIVGFTQMSANEDPKRIVAALNEVFTKFDKLADKHGLEKIKTIGDSYMVAAGIPLIQPDHALRACNMAMDIKREMKDYTIGNSKIEFRIGIDCGAVVAGVIGEKKFIYDLWSDAVNTASRMESTGVAGEIHITDNFKQALEKQSNNFKFQAREIIEVKGKGQMQTWFVG